MLNFKSILVILSLIALTGCAITKETDPRIICLKMKRQLLYNQSSPNIEAKWTTAYQQKEFMDKMREYHCDQY